MKNIIIIIVISFITVILSPTTYAQSATLSLSPSSGTFNKGCPFSLDIKLDTGGAQTDGTDAILTYDSSRFSASSIAPNTSTYPDFPGNNIDDTNGKITISGLASVSNGFSGQATLATINFVVKDIAQAGVSQIKFDFDPQDKSKTTDSNVVPRGNIFDILNSVVNGSYTVGAGTCVGSSPSPSPSPAAGAVSRGAPSTGAVATPSAQQPVGAPTPPPSLKTLPPGGTQEVTATLAIVGSVLTVLGILGLVLL